MFAGDVFKGADRIRFAFKVTAKGPGWIQLQRPLPYNLRTRWQVHVYQFYATVQHSGVEDMTFKFPWGEQACALRRAATLRSPRRPRACPQMCTPHTWEPRATTPSPSQAWPTAGFAT